MKEEKSPTDNEEYYLILRGSVLNNQYGTHWNRKRACLIFVSWHIDDHTCLWINTHVLSHVRMTEVWSRVSIIFCGFLARCLTSTYMYGDQLALAMCAISIYIMCERTAKAGQLKPATRRISAIVQRPPIDWLLIVFRWYASPSLARDSLWSIYTTSWVIPHSTKLSETHRVTTHQHAYGNERVNPHSTKPCKPYRLTTHRHAYGNERVNPHSTRPCKPYGLTTHRHAYSNERVNPHSTKPFKPYWLTTHLHAYSNERVNPHSTRPCKPYGLTTHRHAYGNERVNPHSTKPLKHHWNIIHLHDNHRRNWYE